MSDKNSDLISKLQRLSTEVGDKLKRRPKKTAKEVRPEIIEMQLANQISCLEKTEMVLNTEIGYLKSKLAINTSGEKIIKLENKLKQNIQRNECIQKIINKKAKDLKRGSANKSQTSKSLVLQPNGGTIITYRNENDLEISLERLLEKERIKAVELAHKTEKEEQTILAKSDLYTEISDKITVLEEEIGELKKIVPENPVRELLLRKTNTVKIIDKKEYEELKTELAKLKGQQIADAKQDQEEHQYLEGEIELAKEKLRTINVVWRHFSHEE